jgi:hypothetical protein
MISRELSNGRENAGEWAGVIMRTITIGILSVVLALNAAETDTKKNAGEKKTAETRKSEKSKAGKSNTDSGQTDTRERKSESPTKGDQSDKTAAPEMRPTDPLNPDPMRPGATPTFPPSPSAAPAETPPIKPQEPAGRVSSKVLRLA